MRKFAMVLGIMSAGSFLPVSSEPPTDFMSARSLHAGSIQEPRFNRAVSRLGKVFGYPINFERFPEEDSPGSSGGPITLEIRRNELLSSLLDRLLPLGEGIYLREDVKGQIVIRPTSGKSLLDLQVEIDLTDATTWEAIKAVAMAVNRHPDADKSLEIAIPNIDSGTSHLAPPSFTQDRVITIQGGQTNVRSILCEIFSQAPCKLSYNFSPDSARDGHLMMLRFASGLVAVEDGHADVPVEVQEWWANERKDIAEAFTKR